MVDVTKIPSLMRAQSPSWGNAARLQDIWFGNSAATAPAFASPDTTTIKMDSWYLTFPRAQKIYGLEIVDKEHWKTPKAEARLRDLIEKSGILTGGGPIRFGNLGRPVDKQDLEFYQFFNVRSSIASDPLDDLYGALGNYNLHLVAEGGRSFSRLRAAPSAAPTGAPTGS
jgi:hypothetical protein